MCVGNQRRVHVDITSFCVSLRGDWACTLCRTDRDPVDAYDCEDVHSSRGKAPYPLSSREQRVSLYSRLKVLQQKGHICLLRWAGISRVWSSQRRFT